MKTIYTLDFAQVIDGEPRYNIEIRPNEESSSTIRTQVAYQTRIPLGFGIIGDQVMSDLGGIFAKRITVTVEVE